MKRLAIVLALTIATSCTSGDRSTDASPSPPSVGGFAWQTHGGLPTPRTEVAAGVIGTQVFVVGGFTADGRASAAVEMFDTRDERWSTVFLPSLPEPLHHTAMVAVGARLFVFGGYRADGTASAKAWFLDPTSDAAAWESLPDMPVARGAHAAVLVGDAVHVVGGASRFGGNTKLVAAHHAYDVRRRTWSTLPALPDQRDHLAAAAIGDNLYVVGGRKLSAARNTGRLDVFDTHTRTWTRGPDMPTPRGGIAAATLGSRMFVFGGEEPSGTFDDTEIYDPVEDRWAPGPPMPTARHGLGAATMPVDRIAVAGGGPEPGLTVSDVLEFLVQDDA